ncbi:ImmA/IrrE family metallo-endopeptidase [Sporosarcina sp. Te-1]|uniref:ImmA/IrrE family metallo-endopeptidase n=1 Tax=Sporosarcina sp. Te-1 TaxID=2818390 RepID=UPI001A9E0557|nr:ImmA/IrrE family metallo-endopeptidase [Sporosarcina sp. Te-1]QTD40640.1 ImmA/IrrE family metallo-endopeptidase [Sporosarcina sp. Te-1]
MNTKKVNIIYQYSHLEDYIHDLYQSMNISVSTQINKYLIAERLDIHLYLIDGASEAVHFDNKYYIFINRHANTKQKWQDFGHELCHVLRHEGHQRFMCPAFRELQEWQADNFMYHFCIPTFMLTEVLLPQDQYDAVCLIADTFNVEYGFAEERLKRYQAKLLSGGLAIG